MCPLFAAFTGLGKMASRVKGHIGLGSLCFAFMESYYSYDLIDGQPCFRNTTLL